VTDRGRIVVVGGSLAGLRAAETLRTQGFDGELVVVGAEPHLPYDRPPLSKKLLAGEWDAERIALRRPDAVDELDARWRLRTTAVALDAASRRIELDDGTSLGADGVIVATGAAPRRLPGQHERSIVHELRTLDDALALRAAIAPGSCRVVVVGAGFIGLEVAATARRLGNEVTVLEGAAAPLVRGVGAHVGRLVGDLFVAEGVDVRCGVSVDTLTDDGVVLAGGEVVPADVIVVGIGVAPATDWLDGSGIAVDDGILCNATLQVTAPSGDPVEGVFAAGDVARWWNPRFDERMRVEHWTNAAEQGAAAASNLLASGAGEAPEPYAPVPFVWSDQFDHRLQYLGHAAPDDEVLIAAGSAEEGRLLALYGRAGRLRAAFGLNAPRWVMPMRQLLLDGATMDDALARCQTRPN
jgi:NADPH-dependent 2,4-dienoyl-CoA reductase/sulfur reductase-like enzyme